MAYPDNLVDKRIVGRNIRKGVVSKKDYDKQLAQLPDRAENAEWIGGQSEAGSDDDEGDDED
jgi:hypothetical protein